MRLLARAPAHGVARRRGAALAFAFALGAAVLLAPRTATAAAAADTPAPALVQAPHYGDALFDFYQGRHFEAVTGLLVSQHFGRVAPHDDEAELLGGGLLLSWGLHREAGEVFERLLAGGAPPAVHDRAWFHLAKIRYQRGLPDEAEAALSRIGQALPPALEEERVLLTARLLMARGDHAAAAERLATLPPAASAFARFNLGVALVKSGDRPRGIALLDELGQQGAADEEQRALRDRANVVLGFAALQSKLAADARRYLLRVRTTGPDTGKALLAYGWAALEQGEPKQALVPWGELLARPVADAAAAEARLAVAYALGEAGAPGQALERYQGALAAFEQERRDVDTSIAAIRDGRLVAALLERNPRSGMGWFGGVQEVPATMPHAAHLAPVMATHEFQEAFKNLHDIVFLGENLAEWLARLVTYQDMLDNRRRAFAERLPRVRAAAGANDFAGIEARWRELAQQVEAATAAGDGVALADAREREQLGRLSQALMTLHAAGGKGDTGDQAGRDDDGDISLARERVRRVAGALVWQLQERHAERLWEAQRSLQQAAQGLAQARERDAALLRAQAQEPRRFDGFDARIQAVAQRIAALLPRVAALRTEQAAQLQEIAVAALRRQQERLDEYGAQARLGIAQLYDRARLAEHRGPAGDEEAKR